MNNSITSFNDCKLFHYVVYQFIQPICILLNICVVSTFPNYISMHMCLVAKSCPTFCDPMDCSPSGPLSMGFPKQEHQSGFPFPPPWNLLDTGIKLTSPALLACRFFTPRPPGKPDIYQYNVAKNIFVFILIFLLR